MQDPDETLASPDAPGPEPESLPASAGARPSSPDSPSAPPSPDSAPVLAEELCPDAAPLSVAREISRPDPADGLRLALLVGIALLLCACTSALFTVYPLVSGQNLAAAPRDEPPPEDEEPFRDLFLHDLVVGLVELQRQGPANQQITQLQARALLPMRPAIVERLHADLRAADPLDGLVRSKLTESQMLAIRNLQQGGLRARPWSLDDYAVAFSDLLDAVAEGRPFANPFPGEPPSEPSPEPSPLPSGAPLAPSPLSSAASPVSAASSPLP